MHLKTKYIAYYDDGNMQYIIYKNNGINRYVREGAEHMGIAYAMVDLMLLTPHKIFQSDTLEGIAGLIKMGNHVRQYGDGTKGNCACPKCGYQYKIVNMNLDSPDTIENEFSEVIDCICGCKFEAIAKVSITYTTIVR